MDIIKNIKKQICNIDVSIPRDRDGSFEPKLVKKKQTIIEGRKDLILSLYDKRMSVRDIRHHLDVYMDISYQNRQYQI